MKKLLFLLAGGLLLLACQPLYRTRVSAGELAGLVAVDNPALPAISAHRAGGHYPGYPENSLAACRYVLRHTPALLEVDITRSADSVLLLLHDDELDRTTTGTGPVTALPWRELKRLRLEDIAGAVTSEKIPRLARLLRWAKGKAILTLDKKDAVSWERVIDAVRRTKSEDYVILIAYSLEEAREIHALAPDLVISSYIDSRKSLQAHLDAGLPAAQLIAFTGTRLRSSGLYRAIREAGIPTMLGTLGRLDKSIAQRGDSLYMEFLQQGIDVLATDRPIEAGAVGN